MAKILTCIHELTSSFNYAEKGHAKNNYSEAVQKEANNEHLSPKEKAIHLLDSVTDLLKAFGTKADSINSKVIELKELLINILKIASDQSKSYTADFLNRKNQIEEHIKSTSEDILTKNSELSGLKAKNITINDDLESKLQKQSNVDEKMRELDGSKSLVSNELRSLEKDIADLKLELRTHEINLENASTVLEKAGVKISDLDSYKYQGADLLSLENSLDEIQKNIAELGSSNLASPEEYLERQNDLIKSISEDKTALERTTSQTTNSYHTSIVDQCNNKVTGVIEHGVEDLCSMLEVGRTHLRKSEVK